MTRKSGIVLYFLSAATTLISAAAAWPRSGTEKTQKNALVGFSLMACVEC